MTKRADHTGSIRQRPDGRWEGRISIGGRQISRYGTSREDVAAKLQELQSGVPLSLVPNGSLPLQEWVVQWLVERDLRPSAHRTYQEVLNPILADLGHVQLARLNAPMLALQFSLLKARGRGARRLQLAHGYLRGCLARAVELGYIQTNPMSQIKRPKWEAVVKRYWTHEEQQQFLEVAVASPLRYAPLFLLMVTTGLRISEAMGLEVGDVDHIRATITVQRAQVWHSGMGYCVNPTKTRASRRTVTVPTIAHAALDEIPFRTRDGAVPVPNTVKAVLEKLCAEANVPYLTPHGLRHQHAALAYAATGDMYAVQKRLGHANVTTTMGIYGFGLGTDIATSAAIDALFAPTPQSPDEMPTTQSPPPPTQ